MRYPLCLIGLIGFAFSIQAQTGFSLKDDPYNKKVEVLYDERLLTAYCYFDSTEKPVLFPIKTVSGTTVTRGYPIAPHLGERTDHPHQIGLWMNYESVNDLDFWNNSFAISADKKSHYGSIRHQKILKSETKEDNASLVVLSHWVNSEGKVLLEETTRFVFIKKENDFIIDRIALLEAKEDVLFKDVKDGLLGIRVARELEMPSAQEDKFVDAQGNVTAVSKMDNTNVSGMYFNKEKLEGDKVWGKRSRWTCLQGEKDGEKISIAIIDHPKNVGYPTYWHARGYGLFAANPLGQKIFSEGEKEMNFSLKKGRSTSFRYRVIIHSTTPLTPAMLNKQAAAFASLSY
ncbi:MAG TPA: PmoA family protein [Cyclobacteriaceae bacterium]